MAFTVSLHHLQHYIFLPKLFSIKRSMQVLCITVHVRQHNLFRDRCSPSNSKVLCSQLLSPIPTVSHPCLEQGCSQQTGANCCAMKSEEKKPQKHHHHHNPSATQAVGPPSSNTFASVRSNQGKCFTWEDPKKICSLVAGWHCVCRFYWGHMQGHWYQISKLWRVSPAHFSFSLFPRSAQSHAIPWAHIFHAVS